MRKALLSIAALMAFAGPSNAWQGMLFENMNSNWDANLKKIEEFINNTCKPDSMGDFSGFSSQNADANGKAMNNFYIICKEGSGKLKVSVISELFQGGGNLDDFVKRAFTGRSEGTAIGFYSGSNNSYVYIAFPR